MGIELQKKLTTSAKNAFQTTLESISENPLSGKPLHGNLSGLYSIRFSGNYRIVYKIVRQNDETIVRIFEVGDRKDIYERIGRYFLF